MAVMLNANSEAAQARWQAWFDGTLTHGPILAVTAPLDAPRQKLPLPAVPATALERRFDPECLAVMTRNNIMGTWYGGDAQPSTFLNHGPGSVAAYIGGRAHADERTVWFDGFAASRELDFIREHVTYDPQNPYWRQTLACARRMLELADGDYPVSIPDLGGELDILVSFRGNENLLCDLIDQPESVCACEERISELWLRYFEEINALFRAAGQSTRTTWLPCPYPDTWSALQCDMSVMFSTQMFEQFVVPGLRHKAAAMSAAIYHWDGPGQLQHVEAICSVDNIRALEYVARGQGKDAPNASTDYLPWYLKAADAGRGILIRSSEPQLALELSRRMPSERLAIILQASSAAEGQAILDAFGYVAEV